MQLLTVRHERLAANNQVHSAWDRKHSVCACDACPVCVQLSGSVGLQMPSDGETADCWHAGVWIQIPISLHRSQTINTESQIADLNVADGDGVF